MSLEDLERLLFAGPVVAAAPPLPAAPVIAKAIVQLAPVVTPAADPAPAVEPTTTSADTTPDRADAAVRAALPPPPPSRVPWELVTDWIPCPIGVMPGRPPLDLTYYDE